MIPWGRRGSEVFQKNVLQGLGHLHNFDDFRLGPQEGLMFLK